MSNASSSFSPMPAQIAQVQTSLLSWYTTEQRDLPWRITNDPYAILVSEIMLQQTQVDRVLPKYQQFLTIFPTLSDLAAAPPLMSYPHGFLWAIIRVPYACKASHVR